MINVDIKKKLNSSNGEMMLDIKLSIMTNQIIGICGSSGCGKTTLLKIIAGIVNPDEGKIIYDDKVWFDSYNNKNQHVQDRNIGFVFQDFALFPNMNVEKNIMYGFDNDMPYDIKMKKLDNLLSILDISGLRKRMINNLSGGQKQRVAFARALAREPKLLLLDEPLSSLDTEMRTNLQKEIIKIKNLFNNTIIIVSHDINEIYRLSDFIIKIDNGKIMMFKDVKNHLIQEFSDFESNDIPSNISLHSCKYFT